LVDFYGVADVFFLFGLGANEFVVFRECRQIDNYLNGESLNWKSAAIWA
jgi:hypothetical protein